MKPAALPLLALALGVLAPQAAFGTDSAGQQGLEISRKAVRTLAPVAIWPQGAPAIAGWPGYEHPPVREQVQGDDGVIINVTDPTYEPYLPARGTGNGSAVIIAPGGGFRLLDIAPCRELAAWFAERGIAAFVLKYRLEPTIGDRKTMQALLWELRRNVPGKAGVADGMEALRQIRARASDYAIAPDRIGVIGFSAGGHVAGMMAAASDPATRPDFAGLIYGMPYEGDLIELPPATLPPTLDALASPFTAPPLTPAPGHLPPTFMAMAQDDKAAEIGFRAYYDRLYAAGYRPELHLYQRGGHGFSIRPSGNTTDRFAEQFVAWMQVVGFGAD